MEAGTLRQLVAFGPCGMNEGGQTEPGARWLGSVEGWPELMAPPPPPQTKGVDSPGCGLREAQGGHEPRHPGGGRHNAGHTPGTDLPSQSGHWIGDDIEKRGLL